MDLRVVWGIAGTVLCAACVPRTVACPVQPAPCVSGLPPAAAGGLPALTVGSDSSAIGHIDAGVIARMRQIQLIDHVQLALNHDGSVRKFEVYHNDSAPIPAAVRALLKQIFPQSHILTYETEWHQDDGEITELLVRDANNRICELSATNAGRERYVECRMAPEDLPSNVKDSANQVVPNARIEEANSFEDSSGHAYKLDVREGSLLHGLKIDNDGKLLAHTIKITAQLIIAE
jgi:hypothetical protein